MSSLFVLATAMFAGLAFTAPTPPASVIATVAPVVSAVVGAIPTCSISSIPASPSPTHLPHLTRFYGPVVQNIEVNPIFYGDFPVSLQAKLFTFYGAVVESPWWSVLSQYGIESGSIGRMFTVPASTKTKLDDVQDIKPMLYNLAKTGQITPDPKGNSVYTVHVAKEVTVTYQNTFVYAVSGISLAGYHSAVNVTDLGIPGVKYLVYTVVPNDDVFSPSPTENVNSMFLAATHELVEAVTNPLFDVAMGIFAAQGPKGLQQAAGYTGWVDFDLSTAKYSGEIADFCESWEAGKSNTVGGDGKKYAVAELWSNKDGKCVSF
ncbi:UNVERIFIED_CONTAM: hypothetical protein HDU68_005021 [Siphonaria sp. JEL0065]|nr:hypothetical protein HDU68_005021 [Siphonaria sp. JEL0065]